MSAVKPSSPPDKDQSAIPSPGPLAYSPEQAAECIGLSVRSVYRLLEAKAITARRSGSRTLIDGESLRGYYASLPEYIPGASMPNAPQLVKRRVRAS